MKPDSVRGRFRNFFRGGDNDGQALVEFSIAFPLQLFVTFCIMQSIMFYISAIVVDYAAYRGCRAAAVAWHEDENGNYTNEQPSIEEINLQIHRAARFVLSPLSYGAGPEGEAMVVPGWGEVPGSKKSFYKTRARLDEDRSQNGNVTVIVEFAQSFTFPFVDALFQVFASNRVPDEGQKTTFGKLNDESFAIAVDETRFYDDPDLGRVHYFPEIRTDALHLAIVRTATMYREVPRLPGGGGL